MHKLKELLAKKRNKQRRYFFSNRNEIAKFSENFVLCNGFSPCLECLQCCSAKISLGFIQIQSVFSGACKRHNLSLSLFLYTSSWLRLRWSSRPVNKAFNFFLQSIAVVIPNDNNVISLRASIQLTK